MPLTAPDGTKIVGTLERVPGVAHITEGTLVRNAQGEVTFDYEGGTTMWWDDSKTIERGGQTVFVDEDGDEWLASELVDEPAEEEDEE